MAKSMGFKMPKMPSTKKEKAQNSPFSVKQSLVKRQILKAKLNNMEKTLY